MRAPECAYCVECIPLTELWVKFVMVHSGWENVREVFWLKSDTISSFQCKWFLCKWFSWCRIDQFRHIANFSVPLNVDTWCMCSVLNVRYDELRAKYKMFGYLPKHVFFFFGIEFFMFFLLLLFSRDANGQIAIKLNSLALGTKNNTSVFFFFSFLELKNLVLFFGS